MALVQIPAPSAGENYTLLNTGGTSLSGGAVTINFTSQDNLFILVDGASNAAANNNNYFRLNGDSASNYGHIHAKFTNTTFAPVDDDPTSLIPLSFINNAADTFSSYIWITGAKGSGWKPIAFTSMVATNGTNAISRVGQAVYKGNSAITSITFTANATTFDAGTVYVYGA